MKSRLEKVYGKLPNQKVSLKKVELSLIDDIQDALNNGFSFEETAQEYIDIAIMKSKEASDIIKFNMGDAYTNAEQLLEDASVKLQDLGIDDSSLQPYISRLNELDSLIGSLKQEADKLF